METAAMFPQSLNLEQAAVLNIDFMSLPLAVFMLTSEAMPALQISLHFVICKTVSVKCGYITNTADH